MRTILTIAQKELLDTVRDRRTLLVMIVLPTLLVPLMFVGLDALMKYQLESAAKASFRLAVKGAAPELMSAFKRDKRIRPRVSTDPARDVKNERAELGLIVPANLDASIAAGRPAQIKMLVDESSQKSGSARATVEQIIEGFKQEIVAKRLADRGLAPGALQPFLVKTENIATREEMGGMMLGFILPMILVLWSIMGGMYTAIDVSAGEKERQTLENLLLTPAKRSQVVAGKFLSVFTVSMTTVVLATTSIYFTMQRFPLTPPDTMPNVATSDVRIALAPAVAGLILLIALLVAAFSSAVMLAIGIFAKSFKEGQNYMTPVLFLAVFPTIILTGMPEAKFGKPFFLIPIFNAMLTFQELVMNKIDWAHFALTIASLSIFSALALAVATYIYSQENVMFRE